MRPLPHIRVQLVIPNQSGSQDYFTAIRDVKHYDNPTLVRAAVESAMAEVLGMVSKKSNIVSMKVA